MPNMFHPAVQQAPIICRFNDLLEIFRVDKNMAYELLNSMMYYLAITSTIVGIPSELLRRRLTIRQSKQELASGRSGVAYAERFTKITLRGVLGVACPQLSDLF